MDRELFYATAALYAMQGIQEMGSAGSVMADAFHGKLAKLAFDIADSMLEEYDRRRPSKEWAVIDKKPLND